MPKTSCFGHFFALDLKKERNVMQKAKRLFDTRTLVILAMITGVAFILAWLVRFPVLPGPVPLRFDPKDVVIVIAGFMFGPFAAFIVTVVVSLLQFLTISATGWIGLLMNIISGTAFAVTASFIYSKKRTLSGAVSGLIAGTLLMTAVMMLWNYIVTPIWTGMPREAIVPFLIPFFMPFNIFSGVVNSVFVMLLYKPLTSALKAANLMPMPGQSGGISRRAVVVVMSLFVGISALLWTLAQQEIGPFAPEPAPMAVVNGEGIGNASHRTFPSHVTLNPITDALGLERAAFNEETGMMEITGFIGLVEFRVGSSMFFLDSELTVLQHSVMQVGRALYVPIGFFVVLIGADSVRYEDGQIIVESSLVESSLGAESYAEAN